MEEKTAAESVGGNILYSEVCPNGIEITVTDQSRKIAGDRWLVKIQCRVESSICRPSPSSPDCAVFPKEEENHKKASKVFNRERNFIDNNEREFVVDDLLQQMKSTLFPYLRKRSAAVGLQASCASVREGASGREDVDLPFAHLDSDDGPADFSFLFKEK